MSQLPRSLPQNKEAQLKSYSKRLHDDTKSMLDNFVEILRLGKEEPHLPKAAQAEQDRYEMQVRAANIVRAGESLLRLISDMKQFLILNDFPFVNDFIAQNTQIYKRMQGEVDNKLMALRDELTSELYDLEDEYYSSAYK